MKFVTAISTLLLLALIVLPSLAQSGDRYDLTWSTVDAGGGTVGGNGFVLTGTIGQYDAGTLSAGGFQLHGGFLRPNQSIPTAIALDQQASSTTVVPPLTLLAILSLLLAVLTLRLSANGIDPSVPRGNYEA